MTVKIFTIRIKDSMMGVIQKLFLVGLLLSAGFLYGKDTHILVLHSYNQGYAWTDLVTRGIQGYFKDKPVSHISFEYLDSIEFSDKIYERIFFDLLKTKYGKNRPDVVIVSDNTGLDFLIQYGSELFGKTPVVFCGINNFRPFLLKGKTNYTGVIEDVSMRDTLDLMFKLHPYAKTLHVFANRSSTGYALLAVLSNVLTNMKNNIGLEVSLNDTIEGAVKSVNRISREDLVLFMGVYRDAKGTILSTDESTYRAIGNSRAPVYSLWDFTLGHGVVGGKLVNGYDQGYTAAELAWKIVGGADIHKMPVVNRGPNRFMFDYKMLQRYRINSRFLPWDSVIINRPVPFFEQYRDVFLTVVFILCLFLGILIVYVFQQKKLRETLLDRNLFLQNLIDSIPNPVFYKDLKGHYTGCNRAFEEFVGISKREIIGMTATGIFESVEAERFGEADGNLIKHFKPNVSENRVRRADGAIRDMMISRSLIYQFNKQPFGVVGVGIDVTEQKKAEEEVNRAMEKAEIMNLELEANRDYLNKIINTISDPVFVKDSDLRWVLLNDAYCEFMGYGREDLIGKTDHDFFPKEQADVFKGNDELILRSLYDNANEEEFTDRKGEVHTIITKKSLYIDAAHRKFIVGIISDITERKKLETELKSMNQNLGKRVWEEVNKNREKDLILMKQSRQAAMGEMIRNIAHQWRQPLNALGIIVQNIQERQRFNKLEPEYIFKSVKKAIDLIQFMSRTIDDFKDFFKPDRDKVQFNVKETLFKAVNIVEASMKNNFIEMELHLDRDIMANGYPNEYSQVVLNVLANAKDVLMENRTEKPRVRIALSEKDGRSELRIWNNGGEIPDNVINRMFEPYFTTKENGVGIGLYMSKIIIEKNMNGKIGFRNLDGGAEFYIIV